MKFKIQRPEFNAVMACAGRKDPRRQLNVFVLDVDALRMVATNAAIMGEADFELCEGGEPPVHIQGEFFSGYQFNSLTKPLPKAVEYVIIDTDMERLELHGARYNGPTHIALEPTKECFPDYHVASARNKLQTEHGPAVFGFDTELLHRPAKWSGLEKPYARVVASDALSSTLVTYAGLGGAVFTFMPVRV